MAELYYKELSYKLVGCFYKVYNNLGPGHKEKIYQEALIIEFDKNNIIYDSQIRIPLLYDGKKVGIYIPDFVIDDKIIVELKSVERLPYVFEKQLYYYLNGSNYKLGYLVNFGSKKIDIRRRIKNTGRDTRIDTNKKDPD